MAVDRPTPEALQQAGRELGFDLTLPETESFHRLMQASLDAYDVIDSMAEPLPEVKYRRQAGCRPARADNPFGAWAIKSHIKGAATGKLTGKRVAIKDNTCVAGVPMMNGASILAGYTPEIDATIVTRLLDAGADIHGKSVCEYYCASGGSHTSANGVVENPLVPGHSAGGSSSGSAALVAAGLVDLATGTDQGGSIRIPASFCGVVGLKPTHGLVPYTGIFATELTLDHAGPITRTVADNATMLEVIAGPDQLDPRQNGAPSQPYTIALDRGVNGISIGIVPEAFATDGAEADVDERVRQAAIELKQAGARVRDVSVPLHGTGKAIWTPIFLEGATDLMMRANAYGTNMKGVFLESLLDAHAGWRERADELSDTLKLNMLVGHYMSSRHRGRYYGKAQNLNRRLTASYNYALDEVDLLLMPTTPMAATPLPGPNASREEIVTRAFEMIGNTAPTCLTGHPAMSVPVGTTRDGRPIGAMLIARRFDEITLYRAAAVLEQIYR